MYIFFHIFPPENTGYLYEAISYWLLAIGFYYLKKANR